MAKKRSAAKKNGSAKVNKAEAIRKSFERMGMEARNKDVVESLARKGIEVAPAQVSNIRATLAEASGGGAATSAPASKSAVAAGSSSFESTQNALLEMKQLANRLGGIDKAQQALELLSKLS